MGGLDSLPDAATVARMVMAATGAPPGDLRIAGRGATALTWQAESTEGALAVQIELPAGAGSDAARLEGRAGVLACLHALDARCPRPLLTSQSADAPESLRGGLAWAVTTWVEGTPVEGALPAEAIRDLGAVLRALHSIPASGHGLLADAPGPPRGVAETVEAGLASRWGPRLWPFDGRPLVAHPLVRAAPELVLQASALREQLLRYAEVGAAAVCHTDLNASHLLVRAGRLAGVIDFGDAAVVTLAYDLASFAYFHGWEATETLLEGYEPTRVLRDVRRAEAQQLAVVLALQKVEKYATPGVDEGGTGMAHAVECLKATLPLAARRMDA